MTYYVLAETTQPEGGYCACVGGYDTQDEAAIIVDTERLCWSDEGVSYKITTEYPAEWDITNCEYAFLCERVSK